MACVRARAIAPHGVDPAGFEITSIEPGPQAKEAAGQLFTFLRHPGLDATNWRGEHAMRYAVVNRKVWGGNRTHRGADNQAILMSVLRTLKLREIQPIECLRKKMVHLNPPSVELLERTLFDCP
jgi:transposase